MITNTHPTLPEFEYVRLETLEKASEFLAKHTTEARPFLGGTDVFVRMRDGFMKPQYLLDVKQMDGMNDLLFDAQAGLTFGAAVNMNRVIACPEVQKFYPLLAEACRSVASYSLRNRATVVGNLCNASPAGDTLGACLALGGVLNIHGVDGARQTALRDFFLGPGKTTLRPGDIVTRLHFPIPPAGSAGTYVKLGRNKISDLAIVGVTVWVQPAPERVSGYDFRILLASVAPVPLAATAAEEYLAGQPPGEDSFHQAAILAAEQCKPIDDVRSSARYRKAMVKSLTENALRTVWKKLHP